MTATRNKSPLKKIFPVKDRCSVEAGTGLRLVVYSVRNCDNPLGRKQSRGSQVQRFNSYLMANGGTAVISQLPAYFTLGGAGGLEDTVARRKVCCNCKKSHCLKLYCECFSSRSMCDGCNCVDCRNRPEFYETRESAIQSIEEKNSGAFNPKIVRIQGPSLLHHTRGCHCKKSNCLKKYCECYQNGAHCTSKCQCEGCCNRDSRAGVEVKAENCDFEEQEGSRKNKGRKRVKPEPESGLISDSISVLSMWTLYSDLLCIVSRVIHIHFMLLICVHMLCQQIFL